MAIQYFPPWVPAWAHEEAAALDPYSQFEFAVLCVMRPEQARALIELRAAARNAETQAQAAGNG